jgi:serine/threonine protein kinase
VKQVRHVERESLIQSQLNHPLIVGVEGYIQATDHQKSASVMEFVSNGSLADHLPWNENSDGTVVRSSLEEISNLTLSLDARYRAPERFENCPTLKSDIFSFGVIFCELLSE